MGSEDKEPTSMRLVFQYGSNCLESQINSLERLKGDARFVSIAVTVEDYELAFDVFSKGRHCAAADLVSKPGSKAWGVLYEIPEYLIGRETAKAAGNRKSLDAIEGEGTNYERKQVEVRKPDGTVVSALTYTVISPSDEFKTGLDYVRFIIAGFRERGIPSDYIKKVKDIAASNNPELAINIERL